MSAKFDTTRLRRERLTRHWSQEHLAQISGISVRTIQRLERGQLGASETLAAIASAFKASPSRSEGYAGPGCSAASLRRVTPLSILPEIRSAIQSYTELGFSKVDTGHSDCVGVRAGSTYLILATSDFMAGDFGRTTVAPLIGQTIP